MSLTDGSTPANFHRSSGAGVHQSRESSTGRLLFSNLLRSSAVTEAAWRRLDGGHGGSGAGNVEDSEDDEEGESPEASRGGRTGGASKRRVAACSAGAWPCLGVRVVACSAGAWPYLCVRVAA
ncbi:hypothetical protein PR202_ga09860 [Eleusine coracana subsp. coracana]|uniref:Uncharacterized protein n=1 Tax=Eleusine coracana subsp. coracana TaxID=191504 RepID=A0AAV5C3N9_ELECO|nr:hypothetical protein PR202_ga09860 [Eleusine coracana subsp. coracana]